MILFFRRKMEDDLSQKKNTWKYDIFCKCLEKMVYPKKHRARKWSFLYYLERWYFSPENIIFFLRTENERWCYPFAKKKKSKMIFSRKKKILKVIDIQDRILERVPTIFCTFMETFTDVFIYCFLVKKTPGNLI